MNPVSWLLSGLIRAYRLLISPVLPPHCRYWPTCSEYALVAVQRHGPIKGGWHALRRIARCHPWGGSGYDPVPGTAENSHRTERRHDDHSTA